MPRAEKDCCTLTCALRKLAHDAMCEHHFAQRHMPRVSAHVLGARARCARRSAQRGCQPVVATRCPDCVNIIPRTMRPCCTRTFAIRKRTREAICEYLPAHIGRRRASLGAGALCSRARAHGATCEPLRVHVTACSACSRARSVVARARRADLVCKITPSTMPRIVRNYCSVTFARSK